MNLGSATAARLARYYFHAMVLTHVEMAPLAKLSNLPLFFVWLRWKHSC